MKNSLTSKSEKEVIAIIAKAFEELPIAEKLAIELKKDGLTSSDIHNLRDMNVGHQRQVESALELLEFKTMED